MQKHLFKHKRILLPKQRNLTKTEVFTSDLIKKEIQNIDLAINEIKLKMDEFNNRGLEDATPLAIAA